LLKHWKDITLKGLEIVDDFGTGSSLSITVDGANVTMVNYPVASFKRRGASEDAAGKDSENESHKTQKRI
jgi:hypothetical protein